MYGDLNALVSRYHCTTSHASEKHLESKTKTAAQIHTRFREIPEAERYAMSSGYTEVGIAIVEKNNQTYVAGSYFEIKRRGSRLASPSFHFRNKLNMDIKS